MKCELISIGDEILIGQTVNTNASWLGEKLSQIGLDITYAASISDKKNDIRSALDHSFERANIVIVTGGLGPTSDDITKQTIADYFNTRLVKNAQIENKIIEYFKKRNLPILQSNLDQALLPENCQIIDNNRGSASGMIFKKNGVVFIFLPGVPYEMKGIMNDFVFEKILRLKSDSSVMVNKTVRTHGMGESFLAEIIKDWEQNLKSQEIKLAYLPSPGIVKLRLTATGLNKAELSRKIDKQIIRLKKLIPDQIYGFNADKMEDVVGEMLKTNHKTVSTAESCTGGAVAKMLTTKSGSSKYYLGSIISYSNDSKKSLLGVNKDDLNNYGAVSKQVVEQMALGIRKKLGTDFGLATSGIAGPTGATKGKPVGTIWICVSSESKIISKKLNLGYSRERNIHVTALSVLNLLRLELK